MFRLLVICALVGAVQPYAGWVDSSDTALKTLKAEEMRVAKENVLKYLRQISGNKTISGIFTSVTGTKSIEGVHSIHKMTAVIPGVINKQIPKHSSDVDKWNSFIEEIVSIWNDHHLVCIHWWGAENPLSDMGIFTETFYTAVERRWTDLIEDGGYLNTVWKKKLDVLAQYLQKLKSAGVVSIFDIFPTINENKYIWRGRPGLNGTMKLYKITHDYLTKKHGLTSLIWTWSLTSTNMSAIEEFWPGNDYVDVASVYMWGEKELPISKYNRLVTLVGDKPLSMEMMYTVPSRQVLAEQPRWTWFTAEETQFKYIKPETVSNIDATFNSASVINRRNIDFFNHTN